MTLVIDSHQSNPESPKTWVSLSTFDRLRTFPKRSPKTTMLWPKIYLPCRVHQTSSGWYLQPVDVKQGHLLLSEKIAMGLAYH
jgi:hypothetical protein